MTATTASTVIEVAPSRGEKVAADISALVRARNPLLWVVTREEARVEGYLASAAASGGYGIRFWDVAQGVTSLGGKTLNIADSADPDVTLKAIRAATEEDSVPKPDHNVWVMRDLPTWFSGPGNAKTLRLLRNLARLLPGVKPDRGQAIIILSPSKDVPAELADHATVIEWPLPDRTEIAAVLDAAIGSLHPKWKEAAKLTDDERAAAIDAAIGLTGEEAASCYARSLVQSRKVDPKLIVGEKKRIIAREKVLEWVDPLPAGLDGVGGLENLKAWLIARETAYSPKARAYGLPAPKGVLIIGVSGCGKSLTAKAAATAYGVPLLRLDLGALKSKFVGESEGNLRRAFTVITAIGRCVVWIDEVEKSLQGATSGSADGGVSSDALGALLSWMQERTSEAFIVATANDISGLPPEFLRKGRFDEVFFVDVPNSEERKAVLIAALAANGRKDALIDLNAVADVTDQFTGAEIASLVPEAMFAAFADDAREITTEDLLAVAKSVVPLTTTAADKVKALREFGSKNARPATRLTEAKATTSHGRQLDI